MLPLCLALLLLAGCAQQAGNLSPNDNAASARSLPFDRTPDNAGRPATANLADPAIPAGTAMVIRLQAPISSARAHTGDGFQGVLDEPVVLANRVVLANGTEVRGSVLAAKPGEPQEAGYLRLTLHSILLGDKTLDIHTSSLFAKGSVAEKTGAQNRSHAALEDVASRLSLEDASYAQRDVKFSTARRLTFRLLKPVLVPN